MLDWCPVCENLIPPERYTVQLPPLQLATAPDGDNKPLAPPTKSVGSGNAVGAKHPTKRPGFNRQNSKQAPAAKKSGKHDKIASETVPTNADANPADVPPAAPPRQRTVISQGPTPLYCSEKCRREDEEASNALSHLNVWHWAANGYGAHPFTYGSTRSPLPIPDGSSPRLSHVKMRPDTGTSNSTATTATTSTDSDYSLLGLGDDHTRRRPGLVQMTSTPHPGSQSNGTNDAASSAPATTDFASHPPTALHADIAHPLPRGVHLERWRTQPSNCNASEAHHLTQANGLSAVDLYTSAYPLAFAGNRPQMYWRTNSGQRSSRNPSRKPTPGLWDDVTPTQSLLIPRSDNGRKDDSLEVGFTSRRSDSGSSDRSRSAASHRRKTRSRSKHHDVEGGDPRPPQSRSRSTRSGASGPGPSSYTKRHLPSSLGDSRQHYQKMRQPNHPLHSSFSARDAEEEAKVPVSAPSMAGGVSQSVPTNRTSGAWSWVWAPKMSELSEHVPATDSTTSTAGPASPESSTKTPLPISTSSSSATIAALPASVSARLAVLAESGSSASMANRLSGASPPKRNSSLANIAGVAASLFGFGGLGGLTMTAAKTTHEASTSAGGVDASKQNASASEPIRGRSRASSRTSQNHQLLNGNTLVPTGSSITEVSKSPMTHLPTSMSVADFPRARRPLAPLPKDLEEKTHSASRHAKAPLSVDVGAKGKGKTAKVDKSPSVDRDESKSPISAAPKSAWDPDLVRGMKESRRLSREQSTYLSANPNGPYQNGNINPFHASPPTTPISPASQGSHLPPYSQRRRTTSYSHSKSHSRSQSGSHPSQEPVGPLPRVQSNHSMASMTTTSSSRHRKHRNASREPPSPTGTAYSIAGPPSARAPPRGLSMTSLDQQAFGMMQPKSTMYDPGPPSRNVPTYSGGPGLGRTSSQPYLSRWVSTSPGAGESAFGSPSGQALGGYPRGMYAHSGANGFKSKEAKPTGPTYPVLVLPSGTRKKKVWTKTKQPDGREESVLVDGDEEEDVYEKKKRLFYFDG